MSPQRYEAINAHDDEEVRSPVVSSLRNAPSSPPPSFHSRASSPTSRHLLRNGSLTSEAEQNLADTFDDGEASDADNDGDDRHRLVRNATQTSQIATTPASEPIPQSTTPIAVPTPQSQPRSLNRPTNDGVFANLAAKVRPGESNEEKPPSYESAAADATPPYWETTILAPGMSSDEVYVDGLPVGSVFSFVWNGMISMSFQLVGFLLTYLLHTTHAAKNGSRAGLGLTLVQYGFYMKGAPNGPHNNDPTTNGATNTQFANATPPDPNSHTFDPSTVAGAAAAAVAADAASSASAAADAGGALGLTGADWISYILMIAGWFILIRAVSDFLRARRHEQLVLASPTRNLPVAVVAEEEGPETVA